MKISFWGTRGSIARAGPDTLRYGGNTLCVEVRSAAGTLVVIDCGTGAYGLGQALMSTPPQPVDGSLLISHTHWDHIQGLPFFAPLRVPGNRWDIYAPHGLGQSLRETLAGQMQYTYFPITLEELEATVRYHDLVEGVFDIDDIRVRTRYLNHTALTLGYRLEADGVSVVYACDHESLLQQPDPGESEIREGECGHVEFLEDANLVIHDAQYTANEYADRIGWGHSTAEYATAVCRAAGVKRLALTHHDPSRVDAGVDEIVAQTRAVLAGTGQALEVGAAAEGHTIDLGVVSTGLAGARQTSFSAVTRIDTAVARHSVLVGALRPAAAAAIRSAANAENLRLISGKNVERAIRSTDAGPLSLVILDADAAPEQTGEIFRVFRKNEATEELQVPIVVITDRSDAVLDFAGMAADDRLVWPFSEQYARTKIRAWVLRTRCRWTRARLPENETERLAELQRLRILDTEPEERFDLITRIASEASGVPIALISFVDRQRQWFKASVGLDAKETSREVAFCAHAILEDRVLVVPDTLLDPRFADNPLVTGDSRVRFYAGCPIKSSNNIPMGTLCIIDNKPRENTERNINVLKNLAKLVEKELLALS